MSNLSKKDKILLVVIGVIGIFYLYYTFLLNPALNRISESKANIIEYKSQIDELSAKEAMTKKLKVQYEELKDGYNDVLVNFPGFEKTPQIAYDLKTQGNKNNIQILSESYADVCAFENEVENKEATTDANTKDISAVSSDKLYYKPVNISILGNYSNILSMIKDIEEQTRFCTINSISFSKSEDIINCNIAVNYYYINRNSDISNSYEFNKNSYGKSDLFN